MLLDKRGEEMKALEEALSDLRGMPDIKGVLLASTSGAYIAGEPPSSAHLETFTTMSAILLGAAQTATKELKDHLRYVEVKLEGSMLIVMPAGDQALLVMEAEDKGDKAATLSAGMEASRKIEGML